MEANRQTTWGLDDCDQVNARIISARLQRMEEGLAHLLKGFTTWQQQKEQQQTGVQVIAMDAPMQSPLIIRNMMAYRQHGSTLGGPSITNGIPRRKDKSPDPDDSPEDRNNGNSVYNFNKDNSTGGGGDDGDANGVPTAVRVGGRFEDRGREFSLVKFSNIIIQVFSGKNLNNNFYLPFNKSLTPFIYNKGVDGERLLEILESVEKFGVTNFDDVKLKVLFGQYPKAAEYNRAITPLLRNYTTGIATGMVEHGVEKGFDAWRRLCHHYIPLAEDLKKIFMQEFYALKPVQRMR